jgi:DNA-binding CsgD family transcriptional regulator
MTPDTATPPRKSRRKLATSPPSARSPRGAADAAAPLLSVEGALSIGLRIASAVGHHGDRASGLRAVALELSRAFEVGVAVWHVTPDGARLAFLGDHHLSRAQHAGLAADADVWPLAGDRGRRLASLAEFVRGRWGVPDLTLVDVTCAVLVLGGRCPEVHAIREDLAALLLALPDTDRRADAEAVFAGEEDTASIEQIRLASLTPREREVLVLIEEGESTATIAKHLAISRNTVKTHIQNLLAKLDVGSRLEAAALARRNGFVGLSPLPT